MVHCTFSDPLIMDFDDGVDAIEFMIKSFGFDELELLRDAVGGEVVERRQLRPVTPGADDRHSAQSHLCYT